MAFNIEVSESFVRSFGPDAKSMRIPFDMEVSLGSSLVIDAGFSRRVVIGFSSHYFRLGTGSMKSVEIYTSPLCGFCHAAKRLLVTKGVSFEEIDLSREPARRAEMVQRSGGRKTVPQTFVGGMHVGGYDDLYGINANGRLDTLLAG